MAAMAASPSSSPAKRRRLEEGPVAFLSGLPGALCTEAAKALLRGGLAVAPVGLTGPRCTPECEVSEGAAGVRIRLVGPKEPGAQRRALEEAVKEYGGRLVVVDCTHPDAVDANIQLYASVGCSFVVGTTCVDDALARTAVEGSPGVYGLVAPNMNKQVAAVQATFQRMAADFPGAFAGYQLKITESHQKTKVDTSGTALAMVDSFKKLGLDFKVEDIESLRDEESQLRFGVPKEVLGGHAFHTYALRSPDGGMEIKLEHNACGRRTYGDGFVDAVLFLAAKKAAAAEGQRLFSMIDLLAAGSMG
mmetsp:Transcript_37664/g.99625  ORF Transcript_37664/g.99625 Transcript_37664/m.99625 type:complete len:305 (-) Transcript_37664:28-942(-)